MSGSASGRVQVSPLVKGVFPDGQKTRYPLYIIDGRTWSLLQFSCFTAFTSTQLFACVSINGDWCSLMFASIRRSSQLSVFLFNREWFLCFFTLHCYKIRNRENMLSVPFGFSTSRLQGPAFLLDKIRCHSNFTSSEVSLAQLNSHSPFWDKGHSRWNYNFFGIRQVPQSLRETTSWAKGSEWIFRETYLWATT